MNANNNYEKSLSENDNSFWMSDNENNHDNNNDDDNDDNDDNDGSEKQRLERVHLLQRMNFHISQLPWSSKCPNAPLLGESRQLRDLVVSYS